MRMQRISEAVAATTLTPGGAGLFKVRIISSGTGTSGHYPPATIRDAVERTVWAKGTHVYLDHPSAAENEDRPERSLRDLIGVLDSDATLTEAADDLEEGQVAADAVIRIYAPYRELVAEMADDIGLSIRATADIGPGKADGVEGRIVWRIHEALSVDLVTKAGRGGRVLEILESARTQPVDEASVNDRRDQLRRAVRDAYDTQDGYAYVTDFDETRHLVWVDAEGTCWEHTWQPAADDMSVALTGPRLEVRPITTYHPVNSAGATGESTPPIPKEQNMPQIEEARLAELTAAADRVPALEAAVAAEKQRADAAEADARKRSLDAYNTALEAALTGSSLPAPAQTRLRTALTLAEGADIPADPKTVIETAIQAEVDYLGQVAPAPSRGLGFNAAPTGDAHESRPARTRNAFGRPIPITPKGA